MSERREPVDDQVAIDLVEYLIVAAPNAAWLASVGDALAEVARGSAVRILDLVLLVKDDDGVLTTLDPRTVDSIGRVAVAVGSMLSEHDIELAALAIRPGSAAVVLVTEDRWAAPLSVAAQQAGGQILAGERIPASRVASALARTPRRSKKRR